MSSVQDSFDSYIFKTLYYGEVQIHTRRTRRVLRTHIPNSASTTINWLLISISLTYSPPLLFQSKCQTHFIHGAYFFIGMPDICPYFIFYSIIFFFTTQPIDCFYKKSLLSAHYIIVQYYFYILIFSYNIGNRPYAWGNIFILLCER